MHARQLAECRAAEMHVQALALADEGTAVCCEVQHLLLGDLPSGRVDRLDAVGYGGDVLNGAIVRSTGSQRGCGQTIWNSPAGTWRV
jgi:hypothetical protein